MKTPHLVLAAALLGAFAALLNGCADTRTGAAEMEFRMGPTVSSGGVTNYPAHPGAIYTNVPADYTTNPPPAGVDPFVTIITTNGIHIHSIDGPTVLK
jgi:hypothetical protein